MAEEQRGSRALDRTWVTADLTMLPTTSSPTTPPGFSFSYSSAYMAQTGSGTDRMSPSLGQPSTPSQTASQSQNKVWKPLQQTGHIIGVPPSYQNSFNVETPSPVRTHVAAKHNSLHLQALAKKLAAAYAPSPLSQTSLSTHSGLDASYSPSQALKRKAELAQHFKPVHSFKKVKQSEIGLGVSTDDIPHSERPKVSGVGQSKQPSLDPEELTAKPGSVTPAKGAKRNIGGRPQAKAGSKTNQQKAPTRLRSSRPVAAEIPLDVWGLVLPYCSLDFLFKARLISKSFDHRLSYESTWRDTRIMNYGPDMPGPPNELSEMQYANLLVGQGCMSCGDKKARKTYWAFLRRWCIKCLKEKVTLVRAKQSLPIFEDSSTANNCAPLGAIMSVYERTTPQDLRMHPARSV